MPLTITRVLMLRHGQVSLAWQGKIYGAADVPLSPLGVAQGTRTAVRLASEPIAAVISSGLQRTESMASALRGPRGLVRVDDPELREVERGAWVGSTPTEVDARWPGAWSAWRDAPQSLRAPGGESLADLHRRVRPRLDHWASAFRGQTIALATHGWVVSVRAAPAVGG